MAFLTPDQILGAVIDVSETVTVPEWGGDVIIRGMTGTERDGFEAMVRPKGVMDLRNYRARLLVRVLVNVNGTRLFADVQAADLGKQPAKVIDRLYDVAARLSGMADDDTEELEGNSEAETPATADGSGSPSPSPSASEA
jgi:hypothetical protein